MCIRDSVNSGIENGNFEVARDEILHQLDLCRKGEITDAELESARKTPVSYTHLDVYKRQCRCWDCSPKQPAGMTAT